MLYGIVDTARDPQLYELVQRSPMHVCLFAGDLDEPVKRTAPYLVRLDKGMEIYNVWRAKGWGKAWGILLRSNQEIGPLRKHLRRFLLAQLPDGSAVFFRFYDPRVWNTYWKSCSGEEKSKWLHGVEEFIAESTVPSR